MAYYKKLIGKKCYLSPISEEDAENWVKWYNDIDISMPESNVYDVITLKNTRDMVHSSQTKNEYIFTVVELETDKPIGRVELEANQIYRSGSFGIIIGEKEYWGQGYGKEATQLILDFAFNLLNLHSIMLGLYEFNKRAYNCYKSIGFKEIGRRREYQMLGGKKFDMILMDLLAHEFKSVYVKGILDEMET